jgi:hypothetical protein
MMQLCKEKVVKDRKRPKSLSSTGQTQLSFFMGKHFPVVSMRSEPMEVLKKEDSQITFGIADSNIPSEMIARVKPFVTSAYDQ